MPSFRLRAAAARRAVPIAAAALLCAQPAAAAPADPGPSWSAAPAPGGGQRAGAEEARPYFYFEGGPGTVLEDKIAVSNPGDRPRTVRLRGADASTADGGALTVRAAATGTGAWIALAAKAVTVPPHTRADVPFTVTVPQTALPGDHPGALVVTGDGHEADVRVALRVSGPTLSALAVEDVRVTGRGAAAVIHYALVNHGNTALAPRLAVHADGLFGTVLDRPAHALPVELPPGRRVRLTEKWPGAPAVDSVDVRLTATAGGGAQASGTAAYEPVPWGWCGLALLGPVLGAAAWWLRRRRGRAGPPAAEPQPGIDERESIGSAAGAAT